MARTTSVDVRLSGQCGLSCEVCDCHDSPTDPRVVERLSNTVSRLVIRGGVRDQSEVARVARSAHQAGVGEIVLRSPLVGLSDPGAARQLADWKIDTLLVPILSGSSRVHDRIAGRDAALVNALMGMRAAASQGLRVEIELPLLPRRLQRLSEVIDLAGRAVGSVAAVHFHVATRPPSRALEPGPWSELVPRLRAAIEHCRAVGSTPQIHPRSGIPLCALVASGISEPSRQARGVKTQERGYAKGSACEGCGASAHCFGIRQWQFERHGMDGLAPILRPPVTLRKETHQRRREWTDRERAAARRTDWLVMRLTVNCSQDCVFCSVSEYSKQRWEDPGATYRAIARAARRGVRRVHFTGGEPTLSPHLPDFVDVARRCGIPEIDISTNAISLTNPRRVERLVRAGLTHAFVSLHAHDEELSHQLTQKRGDFDRTTRGIDALLERDVQVTINHVMNSKNYRHLPRFVEFLHERFGGKTLLSLAMITPQYRALENFSLIPKLSDVSPYLMRAAWRCLELGQPFYVGAKQGTPPCFLGPFQAWSDLVSVEDEAVAEDADQKVRAPDCDRCRYTKHCTGIWRPYADRYGLDELSPVAGRPVEANDFWGGKTSGHVLEVFPRSFSEVAETLRDREAEERIRELAAAPLEAPPAEPRRLPVMQAGQRPRRVALFGSAGQAKRLARALGEVPGLVLDSVVSPHMDDDLARGFDAGGWRDAEAALETTTPDLVIVACATRAHYELVKLATAQGAPVLVEKPVGERIEETMELAELARAGARIMPAHNLLFAPGMLEFLDIEARRTRFFRRVPPLGQDGASAWDRQLLGELFYHALVVSTRGLTREPTITSTRYRGEDRPRFIEFELTGDDQWVQLTFDYEADQDELELLRETPGGSIHRWLRSTGTTTRGQWTQSWDMRPVAQSGSEHVAMLTHFSQVADGRISPVATASDAVLIKSIASQLLDALEAAGVTYQRKQAPRRIATRTLLPRTY